MEGTERSFVDIVTGSVGLIALLIMIFILSKWVNTTVKLDVEASTINNKYPLFILLEKDKYEELGRASVICDPSYLPDNTAKNNLDKMCEFFVLKNLNYVTPEESWVIFDEFLQKEFMKDKFYIFSLIKPSGVSVYKDKVLFYVDKYKIDQGSTPLPDNWRYEIKKMNRENNG